MEGEVPSGQLVGEAAKGPNVYLLVVSKVLQNFRGHEALSSHSVVLFSVFSGQVDRKAEVCDLDLAIF